MTFLQLADETNQPIANYETETGELTEPQGAANNAPNKNKPIKVSTPAVRSNKKYAITGATVIICALVGYRFFPDKILGAAGGILVGALAGNWLAQKVYPAQPVAEV